MTKLATSSTDVSSLHSVPVKFSLNHKEQPVHTIEPPHSFSTKDFLSTYGIKPKKSIFLCGFYLIC